MEVGIEERLPADVRSRDLGALVEVVESEIEAADRGLADQAGAGHAAANIELLGSVAGAVAAITELLVAEVDEVGLAGGHARGDADVRRDDVLQQRTEVALVGRGGVLRADAVDLPGMTNAAEVELVRPLAAERLVVRHAAVEVVEDPP